MDHAGRLARWVTARGFGSRATLVGLLVGILVLGTRWPASAQPGTQPALFLPLVASTSTVDPRFGMVVSGDVPTAVNQLGLTWWYSFGQTTPGTPGNGVAQISLRPGGGNVVQVPVATLQSGAKQHPGSYWIIGNEPNVPGQDNESPSDYATQLAYYVNAIKGADPTAQIVGPNALNWDYTCTGCTGYTSGHSWVDSFRTTWASTYGGEPPIDVWSLHAYQISWDQLPMTDPTIVEQQITGFASYLSGISADQAKPIWLTEFGIIWAYPGWVGTTSGCATPPNCYAPTGAYDAAGVIAWLNELTTWLMSNSAADRLQRWFLYASAAPAEPYATVFTGVSLLSGSAPGATLTQYGQVYRQAALP